MSVFDECGRPIIWFQPHMPNGWPTIFHGNSKFELTRDATMQLLKLCADALADKTRKENG